MFRAEFPRRANKTAVRILLVWTIYSLPDGNWDQRGLTDNHPRVKAPGVGARGRRPGLWPQGARAAVPQGNPRRQRRAGGFSPRDSGAAPPPRTPTPATRAAREPRPRRRAGGSAHPPCRVSRKKRAAGVHHSLSHSAKPESLAFLR